jgi:phosphoglycolate phosphatase
MSVRGRLFDLDGTLVDSAPDLADAIGELMRQYDLAPHSLAAVRGMVGHGIEKLVERAFRAHGVVLSAGQLAERYERMMDIYGRHLTARTTLLPGALEALEDAKARGLGTAVVTNKPEGFSRTILAELGLAGFVDVVVGGDSGFARKPAPDMLLAACRMLGLDPLAVEMVGDSAADVASACAARIRSVVVRGGYTDRPAEELGADHVIGSLAELCGDVARA